MVNKLDYSVRDYLKSIQHCAMKLFRTYDTSNRVQFQYEAPADTPDGGICMRTQYAYDGTSTRVVQMAETLDTWQAAWDL